MLRKLIHYLNADLPIYEQDGSSIVVRDPHAEKAPVPMVRTFGKYASDIATHMLNALEPTVVAFGNETAVNFVQ